jgi:ribokinase
MLVSLGPETGAGDSFTGYFAAALEAGQGPAGALSLAAAAAALKVTRAGAAEAIPALAKVREFLSRQGGSCASRCR